MNKKCSKDSLKNHQYLSNGCFAKPLWDPIESLRLTNPSLWSKIFQFWDYSSQYSNPVI